MQLLKVSGYHLLILIMLAACQPEEEIISNSPSAFLRVSSDTILFDTLLTEKLSLTKRFRIVNPGTNAVRIDEIHLGLGNNSDYRIFANGKEGPSISGEIVNGGDSVLVLVDAEIDPMDEELPYLVKDSVIIEWNSNTTYVNLISWGQDANYITDSDVCDATWNSLRPYVIYDSLLVQPNCTLRIEKGVRLLFNSNAALHVAGTLIVEGDSNEFVTFRNTRFDENYLVAPGQWGNPSIGAGIIFYPQSKASQIKYAIIENAISGIYIGTPDDNMDFDLTISNTIIRHMSRYGLLAFTSDLHVENTLIHNCGSSLIANLAGGTYEYIHCTLSNFPNFSLSDDPAMIFSDNLDDGTDPIIEPLDITLTNSIVWGAGEIELLINTGGGAENVVSLSANIIRSLGTIPNNYTSVEDNFPGFKNPLSFDYQLDSLSFAVDKGSEEGFNIDLKGRKRNTIPDIGAFEYVK